MLSGAEEAAEQVSNILKNAFKVQFNKEKNTYVFPSEKIALTPDFTKETVMTMLNCLNKINRYTRLTDDIVASLEEVHSETCKQMANTIIDEVKKSVGKSQPIVTYANKAANPPPSSIKKEEGFKMVIGTKDATTALEEIRTKISTTKKKIRLTRVPHVVSKNTLIMNFEREEDLNKMKKEIENLKLPETTIKQQNKLHPTIRVFDVGNTQDEQISSVIEDITGDKPILISGRQSPVSKKRHVIVRLSKDQYYSLIEKSPNRIYVEYNSFKYEKFISVRYCTKCKQIGHSANFCKLDEKLRTIVDKCEKNRTCCTCVMKEMEKEKLKEPSIDKALEAVLGKVTHRTFALSCTEYLKLVTNLEKRYDY